MLANIRMHWAIYAICVAILACAIWYGTTESSTPLILMRLLVLPALFLFVRMTRRHRENQLKVGELPAPNRFLPLFIGFCVFWIVVELVF